MFLPLAVGPAVQWRRKRRAGTQVHPSHRLHAARRTRRAAQRGPCWAVACRPCRGSCIKPPDEDVPVPTSPGFHRPGSADRRVVRPPSLV